MTCHVIFWTLFIYLFIYLFPWGNRKRPLTFFSFYDAPAILIGLERLAKYELHARCFISSIVEFVCFSTLYHHKRVGICLFI